MVYVVCSRGMTLRVLQCPVSADDWHCKRREQWVVHGPLEGRNGPLAWHKLTPLTTIAARMAGLEGRGIDAQISYGDIYAFKHDPYWSLKCWWRGSD